MNDAAKTLPSALHHVADILAAAGERRLAFFLDFDGTLSPIVEHPDQARLLPGFRATLVDLSKHAFVAIVSGRDAEDVKARVGLPDLAYAGSHGFEVLHPKRGRLTHEEGKRFLPALDGAEHALRDRLRDVPGAIVERKRFSIAAHHRMVKDEDAPRVEKAVDEVLAAAPRLRKGLGKKVFELRPDNAWDKGHAVEWLLRLLGDEANPVFPIYIGDDVTDEDAFRAMPKLGGIGVVVMETTRETKAKYVLRDPDGVRTFLDAFRRA